MHFGLLSFHLPISFRRLSRQYSRLRLKLILRSNLDTIFVINATNDGRLNVIPLVLDGTGAQITHRVSNSSYPETLEASPGNSFMKVFIAVFWLVLVYQSPDLAAEDLMGRVVKVADGDTVTIVVEGAGRRKIRLYGIDTPELDQPWGREAGNALEEKVMDKNVFARVSGIDRYGRTIADIFIGKRNINHEMVAEGHAWAYRRYLKSRTLVKLEQAAKSRHKGLWAVPNPVPPWEWRKCAR